MVEGESTFLQVDLSQSATKVQEPKAPSLGSGLALLLLPVPPRPSPKSGRSNQYDHGG